jgi:hypothetical protein
LALNSNHSLVQSICAFLSVSVPLSISEMTNNNIKKKIKKKEKKRQVEIEVLVCDRHKHVAGLNQLNKS